MKDSQLTYLADALFGNMKIQKESIFLLDDSLQSIKKDFNDDLAKNEVDLNNLSYIARDIRDNFQFTISIIDEIGTIDELISQLNILALNLTVEASKIDNEIGNVFNNLATEIREKGDRVQGVIERVFTKEIRNKSFSEHNRYIKNSILPQVNKRVESLDSFLGNRESVLKEFKKTDILVEELQLLNSGNKTILNGIINFTDNLKSIEPPKEIEIQEVETPKKETPIKKISGNAHKPLGKIQRGIQEF